MGIRDRLKQRREQKIRDLRRYQRGRDKVTDGRLNQLEVVSKNLNKRQRNINVNTSGMGSGMYSNMLYGNMPYYGGCPYFNSGSEQDEPFGWKKGTVRATITLWAVLAFLIGFILGYIPILIAAPIFTAIIMSYFVMRPRMF